MDHVSRNTFSEEDHLAVEAKVWKGNLRATLTK